MVSGVTPHSLLDRYGRALVHKTTMDELLRQAQEEIAATKKKLATAKTAATTMDDELIQVKAKIARTEIKLSKAEAEGKEELVLSLTNLLVGLNQKELLLLSAGEMHYNGGVCDIV
jgi:septal ring factor EnvC (AmiA/AmiB activator)